MPLGDTLLVFLQHFFFHANLGELGLQSTSKYSKAISWRDARWSGEGTLDFLPNFHACSPLFRSMPSYYYPIMHSLPWKYAYIAETRKHKNTCKSPHMVTECMIYLCSPIVQEKHRQRDCRKSKIRAVRFVPYCGPNSIRSACLGEEVNSLSRKRLNPLRRWWPAISTLFTCRNSFRCKWQKSK